MLKYNKHNVYKNHCKDDQYSFMLKIIFGILSEPICRFANISGIDYREIQLIQIRINRN